MSKVAVYPGSFDPFTLGHKEIVEKSLEIFDEVVIAVGYNINKQGYYTIEKRIELIDKVFCDNKRVRVVSYTGLTSEFCKTNKFTHIVRGLRNARDFEFEREIALINKTLNSNLETIFLLSESNSALISSSTVRELLEFGADPMQIMPPQLTMEDLKK